MRHADTRRNIHKAAEHIVAVAEEHIAVGNVVVVDTALCSWERIAPQAYRL